MASAGLSGEADEGTRTLDLLPGKHLKSPIGDCAALDRGLMQLATADEDPLGIWVVRGLTTARSSMPKMFRRYQSVRFSS
jgi:hypothetical protein